MFKVEAFIGQLEGIHYEHPISGKTTPLARGLRVGEVTTSGESGTILR